MKRYLRIHFTDKSGLLWPTDLELTKVTILKDEKMEGMFHIDELKDKTYRLTVSESFIKNISNLDSIQIIREDD